MKELDVFMENELSSRDAVAQDWSFTEWKLDATELSIEESARSPFGGCGKFLLDQKYDRTLAG
jgi:hypothetical protein